MVRIYESGEPIRSGDKQFNDDVAYVDPGFFDVFDLPIARGERQAVLRDNTSLLLSEAAWPRSTSVTRRRSARS